MKPAIAVFAVASLCAGIAIAEAPKPAEVMFEDGAVAKSLTGAPGDAASGAKVFANRKLGNCLACHMNSDMPEQPFHGEVGPALDGAGSRWSEAELRGIVTNSKEMFPETIMPAFYRLDGFNRTLEKFDGKTILTPEQVEDVVAYLLTLKDE